MAWKSKNKELTRQEAIHLARKELAPYWHGSAPLIAGTKTGSSFQAFPLDDRLSQQSWIFFFFDPTHLSATDFANYANTIHQRYSEHFLHSALVLRCPFDYLKEKEVIERLNSEWNIDFPIIVDVQDALAKSFGVTDETCAVLLDRLQVLWRRLVDLKPALEVDIQTFLRSRDPGLPLPPPAKWENSIVHQLMQKDFKREPPYGFTGKWQKRKDGLSTTDPSATYTFTPRGQRVSLVAQSMTALIEPVKVSIKVNGTPASESWCKGRLFSDENGRTYIGIKDPGAYVILDDPAILGSKITLEFITADKVPVAIYGVRSGSPLSP